MTTTKGIFIFTILLATTTTSTLVASNSQGAYSSYDAWKKARSVQELYSGGMFCGLMGLVLTLVGVGAMQEVRPAPMTLQAKLEYVLEQQMDPETRKQIREEEKAMGKFMATLGVISCIAAGWMLVTAYCRS